MRWGLLGCGVADVGRFTRRRRSGPCPRCGRRDLLSDHLSVRCVRIAWLPVWPVRRAAYVSRCRACDGADQTDLATWRMLASGEAVAPGGRRTTACLVVAASGVPAVVAVASVYLAFGPREVYLVSGLPIDADVSVNGDTHRLEPFEARPVLVGPGTVSLVSEGRSFGRVCSRVEVPSRLRSLLSATPGVVLNADGRALLERYDQSFDLAAVATTRSHVRYLFGRRLYRVSSTDYVGSDPPRRLEGWSPESPSAVLGHLAAGGAAGPGDIAVLQVHDGVSSRVSWSQLPADAARPIRESLAYWTSKHWSHFELVGPPEVRLRQLRRHADLRPPSKSWIFALAKAEAAADSPELAPFDRLVAEAPSESWRWVSRGVAKNRFSAAEADFREAWRIDANGFARTHLSAGLAATGRFDEAAALYTLDGRDRDLPLSVATATGRLDPYLAGRGRWVSGRQRNAARAWAGRTDFESLSQASVERVRGALPRPQAEAALAALARWPVAVGARDFEAVEATAAELLPLVRAVVRDEDGFGWRPLRASASLAGDDGLAREVGLFAGDAATRLWAAAGAPAIGPLVVRDDPAAFAEAADRLAERPGLPTVIRAALTRGDCDWPQITDWVTGVQRKAAVFAVVGWRWPAERGRAFREAERLNVVPTAAGVIVAATIAAGRAELAAAAPAGGR